MPTIFRSGPYRFFFYAGDGAEPPHVHIRRDDNVAKYWLQPVRVANAGGFPRKDIIEIHRLVEENEDDLLRSWNEFFED